MITTKDEKAWHELSTRINNSKLYGDIHDDYFRQYHAYSRAKKDGSAIVPASQTSKYGFTGEEYELDASSYKQQYGRREEIMDILPQMNKYRGQYEKPQFDALRDEKPQMNRRDFGYDDTGRGRKDYKRYWRSEQYNPSVTEKLMHLLRKDDEAVIE